QKCKACEKTVYPVELLSADGVPYHKSCFKCSHCKGTLKDETSVLILKLFRENWYCPMYPTLILESIGSHDRSILLANYVGLCNEVSDPNLVACLTYFQLGTYSSMEGVLYCKPRFEQLFKETGNLNKNFQSRKSFSLAG
ncbi:hypothetical protein Gotri_011139, partial [Gossypium trilobum]|nr:hypothetical protein [Gossypium trilobum]